MPESDSPRTSAGSEPGSTGPASTPTGDTAQPGTGPHVSGEPSVFDDFLSQNVPEAADATPGRRRRKALIWLCSLVATTIVGAVWAISEDWLLAEHDARVSSQADDKVDREGPAFSGHVRLDTQYPEATLFDSPFSAREKQKLVGPPHDLRYLSKRPGARGVSYSDVVHTAMRVQHPGFSETWLIDLISDRKAALAINKLQVTGLKCTPARATTAIIERGEGGGSYEGMLFDLDRSTSAPLITGDTEKHYGEPFFRYKKIDLGNGATPGGLRLQVTSGTKDCTWKAFRATYVDSEGTHHQDITNGGKLFRVHGIAARPKQIFEYSIREIQECTPLGGASYKCRNWHT
ncbi:hypothetical protein [Streptomyces sp. BH104]|uniref:hypothetical protein n=1 Tax=Streptomyces sp. BH104 TaxID=3410407 RepID=UPI003BB63DCA